MTPSVKPGVHSPATATSFGAQVLLTGGTNILMALLSVMTGSLAARLLGPDGRGELAAIQMWTGFLAGLANLGLPQALTFYAAQFPARAGQSLGSAICLNVFASFPFMVLGYALIPTVLSAQSASVIAAARCYLLLLPVQAVESMPYHVLRGRSDFAVWNALRMAPGISWLALLVFGWLTDRSAPSFFAMAYLVAVAVLCFPNLYVVRRRLAGSLRPDPQQWRPMLRFGLPTMLSGVPQVLNLRLDQMLMAAFLPVQTLGLYVVAVTWSAAVVQLPNALANVILPRTASQRDIADQRIVFAQGSRLGVLCAITVALGIAVVTPWVIPVLFGPRFAGAIPVAWVLIPAAAVSALNMILEEGLRGLGHPTAALSAETAGLAVTALALLILLRPFGIMGAAVASLLGYSTVALTLIVSSSRVTGLSVATLLCPSRQDCRQIRARLQGHRLHIRMLPRVGSNPA